MLSVWFQEWAHQPLPIHWQVQRRLSAKLDKDAFRLFLIVNVEHVLEGERLEIKFITGVVVGRNRFRIGVHHDRLESELAQGKRGMHAAIIKFDALADPVRVRHRES